MVGCPRRTQKTLQHVVLRSGWCSDKGAARSKKVDGGPLQYLDNQKSLTRKLNGFIWDGAQRPSSNPLSFLVRLELLVVEQIDIHTNFTARQMLYLYRSGITRCRNLPHHDVGSGVPVEARPGVGSKMYYFFCCAAANDSPLSAMRKRSATALDWSAPASLQLVQVTRIPPPPYCSFYFFPFLGSKNNFWAKPNLQIFRYWFKKFFFKNFFGAHRARAPQKAQLNFGICCFLS